MQVETTYLKRSLRDMNEFLMLTYVRSKYVESAPSVLRYFQSLLCIIFAMGLLLTHGKILQSQASVNLGEGEFNASTL